MYVLCIFLCDFVVLKESKQKKKKNQKNWKEAQKNYSKSRTLYNNILELRVTDLKEFLFKFQFIMLVVCRTSRRCHLHSISTHCMGMEFPCESHYGYMALALFPIQTDISMGRILTQCMGPVVAMVQWKNEN